MIYIRTDSNNIIASGHVMRCLSIADEFKDKDIDVIFITADANSNEAITSRGYKNIILNSDWQNLNKELEQVKKIVSDGEKNFLLIDTYSVIKEYVNELADCCKIGYLGSKKENLGNLDILINYSSEIDYDFYNDVYSNHTRLLLGVEYAPLKKDYKNVVVDFEKRHNNVLITTGNTDNENIIGEIIDTILPLASKYQLKLNVVVGSMFKHKEKLLSQYASNTNVILHQNVKSMYELMKKSELAISANGTTVYELIASYVTTISFAMVSEQITDAIKMSEMGITEFCGDSFQNKDNCLVNIFNALEYFCVNGDDVRRRAIFAHGLISGNGCSEICDEILKIL